MQYGKDTEKKTFLGEAASAFASLGGKARAAAMTPKERSESASRAAVHRWAKVAGLPSETYGGSIAIGGLSLSAAVLDNKQRVFSSPSVGRAFGSKGSGAYRLEPGERELPSCIATGDVEPFLSAELRELLNSPVIYRSKATGRATHGIPAETVPVICAAIIDADDAGKLRSTQRYLVEVAMVLRHGFARVDILALIDEATGYQAGRARDELERLLEAYVAEGMRPWVKWFPDRFFQQIYRLHGWRYQIGVAQGPRCVGRFINEYVRGGLPVEVLDELRRWSPLADGQRRRHRHCQFANEDIGHPALDRHLASVMTLMSVSASHDHFKELFRLAFP
jgi:hypothetical protein